MTKRNINRTFLKLIILSVALNEVAGGAVSPAMAVLIDTFQSTYSITLIMMIGTLPQFCQVIFSPIYGKVSEYFTRRQLLFFALACFIIGGVLPAFSTSLPVILLLRAVFGISISILIPLSIVLIDDNFSGHERDTLIGLNTAASMLGGTVFSMLGGYLASIHWSYCFYVYLFPIWVVILAFFFLPEPERKKNVTTVAADANVEGSAPKEKIPVILYWLAMSYLLFDVFYCALTSNAAVLIQNAGFGNAASAGVAFSFLTIGAFVSSLIYGWLYKQARSITLATGVFLSCIGLALCFFSINLTMVIAGCFFSGAGVGIAMPAFMNKSIELVPRSKVPMALSIMTSAMGLGIFLQPIIFNPLLALLHLQIGRHAMGLGALGLLVFTVVALILNIRADKKSRTVAL